MTTIDMGKSAPGGEDDARPDHPVGDEPARPPTRPSPFTPIVGDRAPAIVDPDAPILPQWLRDRVTFTSTAHTFARRNAYRARRQALYTPGYVALLVAYSPRGAARVIAALGRFLYDMETKSLQHGHSAAGETAEFVKLERARKDHLKARWIVTGVLVAALLLLGAGWVVLDATGIVALPPAWATWAALAAGWLYLGWVGRNRDRRFTKATQYGPGVVERVTVPFTTRALCNIGIARLREPDDIRPLADAARSGPGYQVDLELPDVPATAVIARREELAAAMKRQLGCVWPSVGKRHAAHLSLYVCDQPMVEQQQAPWPLLKGGEVDVFRPCPQFTDQRGEWIDLTLAYANMIIGALPRMGKTYLLRQVLLVSGLDKRVKVYALDGKGTGDLSACALFAHFYSRGDKPEQIDRVLVALRALREEMRRRADVIDGLPREEAPESKVDSRLASRRDLGLEPVVVGIDETQAYFEFGDRKNKDHQAIREELIAIVTDLVKRGPALGIIVVLATQQVSATTIPTSISNNAVIRACLKMFGQDPNDRVLGTGSYKGGIDATQFAQEDLGIAYLRAEGSVPRIVRSVWGLDAVAAEKVANRARQLRVDDTRLTGDAGDEVMSAEGEQVVLLDDCRAVLDGENAARMHLGDLRDRLAALRPGVFAHLDNDALGSMLRQAGVRPGTVWANGRDGKGLKREWLDVSSTEHIGPVPDEDDGTVVRLTG